jgi:centromere protein I
VDDFIENLDRIELPNQMVSALDDALLQNYVVLRNSPQDRRRIDLWLSLFFDAQLSAKEDSHVASTVLVDLLEKVLAYSRYTKVRTML